MSEATVEKKNDSGMLKLTVTLGAICAVCALLLGLADMVTRDKIAENAMAAKMDAMQLVLASDEYSPANYTGSDETILSAYKAGDKGYVIEVDCAASSFSGTLSIMVGVNSDGTVSGVSIVTTAETSGLGSKASDPAFKDQYVGKGGTLAVDKDGGEIAAISGATITSRAVTAGVNSALAAVGQLG